jgi:hypothetical protein
VVALHNFIRQQNPIQELEDWADDENDEVQAERARLERHMRGGDEVEALDIVNGEDAGMAALRDTIAQRMWRDYVEYTRRRR